MRLAVTLGILTFAGTVAHAQLTVTFDTTASATQYGYVSGNSYVFSFTTGPSYPAQSNLNSSVLNSDGNTWTEQATSDSQLYQAVSGSGLSGAFVRPTTSPSDPYSYIQNSPGGYFRLYARNDGNYGIGLNTSDGLNGVASVEAYANNLMLSSPSFPNSYVDPTTYFASYLGSYSVTGTVSVYLPSPDSFAMFAVSNVTISSAVPEPSTYAALFGLAALGFTAYRRRRREAG